MNPIKSKRIDEFVERYFQGDKERFIKSVYAVLIGFCILLGIILSWLGYNLLLSNPISTYKVSLELYKGNERLLRIKNNNYDSMEEYLQLIKEADQAEAFVNENLIEISQFAEQLSIIHSFAADCSITNLWLRYAGEERMDDLTKIAVNLLAEAPLEDLLDLVDLLCGYSKVYLDHFNFSVEHSQLNVTLLFFYKQQ